MGLNLCITWGDALPQNRFRPPSLYRGKGIDKLLQNTHKTLLFLDRNLQPIFPLRDVSKN